MRFVKCLHSNRARLLILTLTHFTVDFLGGLLVPLPEPTLVRHLGVGLPRVALLIGGCAIVINGVQPISGFLFPSTGLPLLLAAAPLAAALTTCIGLTTSYWGVASLLLIAGFGIGVLHPEGALAAHSVAGERKGLGVSIFISGGYFGYATGSLVGGLWAEMQNQDLTRLWILGLPVLLVVGLILASGLHKLEGHVEEDPDTVRGNGLPFLPILLLTFSIACTMCLFVRLVTIWLVRRFPGEPAQGWGGSTVFATGLAGALSGIFWGHVSDRFGRGRIIILAQFLGAFFFYRMLQVESPSRAPLWGLGIGLTLGGIFPLTVVLARESRGPGQRLRIGLAIGGAWGLGEVMFILAGRYIGSFPPAAAGPVTRSLAVCWITMIATVVLATYITRLERPPPGEPGGAGSGTGMCRSKG